MYFLCTQKCHCIHLLHAIEKLYTITVMVLKSRQKTVLVEYNNKAHGFCHCLDIF